MKRTLLIAFTIMISLLAASCAKEKEYGNSFLRLEGEIEDDQLTFSSKGTVYNGSTKVKLEEAFSTTGLCPRLTIMSDMEEWEVVPELEEDSEWLFFWPSKGSECGRFFVSVDENRYAEVRSSRVNIVSGGKVMKTITINQYGSAPYLDLDMGGISRFNVAAEEGSITVKLKTNTLWNAEIMGDAPWIRLGDMDDNSITIDYEANSGDDARNATFSVTRVDDSEIPLSLTFTIVQIGGKSSFTKASPISIAELKRQYKGSEEIEDNLYVEGTVISDYRTYNVESHFIKYEQEGNLYVASFSGIPVWIEDSEGNGLCIEFITPAEAAYEPGTKMKVHVVGQNFTTDPASGVLRIAGLTSAYIHDAAPGEPVKPAEVTDLSTIDRYEDCLVTLKDVQFAVPYGTYFNMDNRQVNMVYTLFPAMIDATVKQYPHILYDRNGNTIRLFSASTFLDRHCRLMPKGAGDITGVISRRHSQGGREELVIRLRDDSDNKVAENESDGFAKTLVCFGPFAERIDMNEVRANIGSGQIKTSVFTKATAASSATSMYFNAYASIWTKTFDNVTKDTTPIKPDPSNQYWALNSQLWYNATGTTLTDNPGEAWIITTNTLNAGSGKLFLVFDNGTYSAGPKDFCLEWSTDEKLPVSQWNTIREYEVSSWNANFQPGEFMFALPDEMKGLERVVIRHRVVGSASAYAPSREINTTGTNRMCYWKIIEL